MVDGGEGGTHGCDGPLSFLKSPGIELQPRALSEEFLTKDISQREMDGWMDEGEEVEETTDGSTDECMNE